MKLLYPSEHINCVNYDNGEKALIKILSLRVGDKAEEIYTSLVKIICIIEGSAIVSFADFENERIGARQMMVLPAGSSLTIKAEEDLKMLVFRVDERLQLCDTYSLEKLFKNEPKKNNDHIDFLSVDIRLDAFISSLIQYYEDGLRCHSFFMMKVRELFYLFRAYYNREELTCFFRPLLSNDISFSNIILQSYKKARTVQDLADLTNYSLSGFQKKFRRVFNMSAFQWIREQRVKSIMHEINCTEKTLKEISLDFGFSSPSHFNDFCKMNFGHTPGKIREQNMKNKAEV